MTDFFDAIVIGAGFAGAATAYHLSRLKNWKLLILERELEVGKHASGKNAGLLRQAVADPRVAEMVQATLRALQCPPEDWPHAKIFRETGSLLLGQSNALSGFADALKNFDASFELHEAGSFPDRISGTLRAQLREASHDSLLYVPQDGVVDIRALLDNYLDAARGRGVELRCGFPARKIERDGTGWRVMGDGLAFAGRAVVNAAGPWAADVAQAAGLPGKELVSKRRHLFWAEENSGLDADIPYVWDTQREWYFRPDAGGLLLCGGDEEIHPASDPQVDPEMEVRLREKLRNYYPALSRVTVRRSWACLRTFWSRGPFLAGEEESGFFWVAGLGGHGMGSSFGIGRRAAERVAAFLDRQNS